MRRGEDQRFPPWQAVDADVEEAADDQTNKKEQPHYAPLNTYELPANYQPVVINVVVNIVVT